MAGYLSDLKRTAAILQAAASTARALKNRSLDERIREWHTAQQPDSRTAAYTMSELVKQFGTSPGLIGNALHRLGWKRRRRWAGGAAYGRYWVPPAV